MFTLQIEDNLELGLAQEHHADEVFSIISENYKHLFDWMSWLNEEMTVEDVRQFYRISLKSFAENGSDLVLLIILDGKMVGTIGLHGINRRDKSGEIGYWLVENATGKGLMTKSVERMIDYGFEDLNLNRIVIKCAPENLNSRVLPEKLGFQEEGTEREAAWLHTRFIDHVVYSMLARDWKKGKK